MQYVQLLLLFCVQLIVGPLASASSTESNNSSFCASIMAVVQSGSLSSNTRAREVSDHPIITSLSETMGKTGLLVGSDTIGGTLIPGQGRSVSLKEMINTRGEESDELKGLFWKSFIRQHFSDSIITGLTKLKSSQDSDDVLACDSACQHIKELLISLHRPVRVPYFRLLGSMTIVTVSMAEVVAACYYDQSKQALSGGLLVCGILGLIYSTPRYEDDIWGAGAAFEEKVRLFLERRKFQPVYEAYLSKLGSSNT